MTPIRPTKEEVDRICVQLVDAGKLIEAGWQSFKLTVVPVDAPDVQLTETRLAFFAGAQHLFGSIMSILEPGDLDPTKNDMLRMDAINAELNVFVEEYKAVAARRRLYP